MLTQRQPFAINPPRGGFCLAKGHLPRTAEQAIHTGLPPGVELDEREEAILDLASRQARDVARAESDIAERGYLVPGSRGQQVVNPSVAEVPPGDQRVIRFPCKAGYRGA